MTINLTFDFNCIISLENKDDFSKHLQELIEFHEKELINISVPAISSNEKQMNGEYANSITHFIARVEKLSKRKFEIMKPRAIWDMSFWDYCIWGDETMVELDKEIHLILFPKIPVSFADYAEQHKINPDKLTPEWTNPKCDVISLWCHIYYQHDIFVTNDSNFHKKTKKDSLIKLGAKKIFRPLEALIDLGYVNH